MLNLSWRRKQTKIVIGVDQMSPCLGQSSQRGLRNNLDWILACEYLHKE